VSDSSDSRASLRGFFSFGGHQRDEKQTNKQINKTEKWSLHVIWRNNRDGNVTIDDAGSQAIMIRHSSRLVREPPSIVGADCGWLSSFDTCAGRGCPNTDMFQLFPSIQN